MKDDMVTHKCRNACKANVLSFAIIKASVPELRIAEL